MSEIHTAPTLVGAGLRAVSVRRGTFRCPYCKTRTAYRLLAVKHTVRLVGIDVLPVRTAGQYVECLACAGTFIPEVLDPNSVAWNLKPLHLQAALRVMLLMMLADGVIDDTEIASIAKVYERIGGDRLHRSTILTQAEHARADTRDLARYLSETGIRLNETGKLKVFESAYEVALADGTLHDDERRLLDTVRAALALRRDPYDMLGLPHPEA